jgi:hypothetical protein
LGTSRQNISRLKGEQQEPRIAVSFAKAAIATFQKLVDQPGSAKKNSQALELSNTLLTGFCQAKNEPSECVDASWKVIVDREEQSAIDRFRGRQASSTACWNALTSTFAGNHPGL